MLDSRVQKIVDTRYSAFIKEIGMYPSWGMLQQWVREAKKELGIEVDK